MAGSALDRMLDELARSLLRDPFGEQEAAAFVENMPILIIVESTLLTAKAEQGFSLVDLSG